MTRIIDKILERRKNRKSIRSRSVVVQAFNNSKTKNKTSGSSISHESISTDIDTSGDAESTLPEYWYYSFEFFPPRTEAGLDNLLTRIDRMATLDPLFIDVTWGDAGSTSARTFAIASHAQRYSGVDVLMHLSCTGMTKQQIISILHQAKSCGVHNLLVLRGDPPRGGKRSWEPGDVSGGECDRAIDLVRLIKTNFGNYFGIAVAGHPEGHPSSYTIQDEMTHLKEKIDAGADFIITQFFYDVSVFLQFVQRCRNVGITCPILPGILPIQSYSSFIRMTQFCSIAVPQEVMDLLEPVKHDDEAVKIIGCKIATDMARKILTTHDHGFDVDGIHFYTLNLERSVNHVLYSLGALTESNYDDNNNHLSSLSQENHNDQHHQQQQPKSYTSSTNIIPSSRRQYPWRPSTLENRMKEDVRPINWANRPKSYVMRTDNWDEFPNGRWGNSASPAFGELSDLSHFYSFSLGSEDDRRAMLGYNPREERDVFEVFAKYIEGKVPHIPWCENPLQAESFTIQNQLAALNRKGFLTVNSQPPVNGVPSTHKVYGWGTSGGVVYQKAYCECFVSPENTQNLVEMVKEHESMNLYAVNNAGDELRIGVEEGGVTALTWGVFPNREILQPTIFDPGTFLIWAEEAFSLWTSMWLSLYEMGTESYELIETIRDSYYLVAIIDNNFIADDHDGGDLWTALLQLGSDTVVK